MTQVKHCPWCEGVFSADTADGLCPRCLMQVAVTPEPQTSEMVCPQAMESAGTVIGPYKLLEKIGAGGMAVVYLAEQEKPLHRRVALKIIKLGLDTRQVSARFEAERQALAMMDHPNIAKVFDAGATDLGRPYFVMELVQGLPITEYCDRNRLSTQERLELFIPVCSAVHHAHQKGIIHRDLKPSNILVTQQDGAAVPKVIDFGIAKAMDQRLTEQTVFTRYAEIIGTPEYMSPEQAEMGSPDIDTRTDIYSLGVVLYELLTGTLPFDPQMLRSAGFYEVQRIIQEAEPKPPSTCVSRFEAPESVQVAQRRRTDSNALRRKLSGDLDWITLKAVEKDRDRRYLNHEPVAAGPPSTLYRAGKYVRRHRALVTGVAAVLIALAVGVAGMTIFALKARQRARTAQTVADFLTRDVLGSVTPERTKSPAVTIHSILDSASGLLQTRFANEPLVEASIRQTLGETYIQLGDYKAAEPQLVRAYNIHRKTLGRNDRLTLTSMSQLGRLHYLAGHYKEAEPLLSGAWKETSRLLGEEDPETLRVATWLGLLHLYLAAHGHTDETESLLTRAFETSRRVLGEEHPVTLEAMYGVAFPRGILWGRYNEAAALVAEGLQTCQRVLGDDHRLTLQFMVLSAWLDLSLGRFAEAEMRASASLETNRHILGAEHPETFFATAILGYTYTMQHEYERAEPLLVEAVRLGRRDLGPEHFSTLLYTAYLAWTYIPQGRFDEAELLLVSVLDGRGVLGDEHPIILDAITGMTSLCAMQGQADRLKPIFDSDPGYSPPKSLILGQKRGISLDSRGNVVP